jgi:hypothetical protein
MRSLLIIMVVVTMAALFISFATITQLGSEVRRLSAVYRSLELETANHRAAILTLVERAGTPAGSGAETRAESTRLSSTTVAPVGPAQPLPPRGHAAPAAAALANRSEQAGISPGEIPVLPAGPGSWSATIALASDPREVPAADVQAQAMEPTATDVEEMILEVIAQYVSGLENRSVPALKRVWPTLGGTQEQAIRTEFKNARTVQTLFKDPRITINGDVTTVTGLRVHSLVTQDGQRLSSMTKTTLTLRRDGGAWVIERIVHQQEH